MDIWGTVIIVMVFAIIISKITEKIFKKPAKEVFKDWFGQKKEKVDDYLEQNVSKVYVKQGLKM